MKAELCGKDVSIRPITRENTANIVRWRNNPTVQNYFIEQQRFTPETHTMWLEDKVFSGEVFQFIIQENVTGKDIGSVYIRNIDMHHLHGEYGIFIGEDNCRGKGFGTEACRLICRFAFEQIGLEKIYLRVLATNTRAVRSYEKVGFLREGIFRKHVKVNDNWFDLIFMGLLREEFIYGI